MKNKSTRTVITLLLTGIFFISAGMAVRQELAYQRSVAGSEEAARTAGLEQAQEPAPPPSSSPEEPIWEPSEPEPEQSPERTFPPEFPPEPLPEEALALAETDLEALREVNGEVVGWLSIPGTPISYPLMQGTDNDYYLSHNWKGEPDGSGSVFLEATNRRDLSDFHTIVYAHQMYNGLTMFSTLAYYQDPAYWQAHPKVYIVLDDAVYRYDIFSAQEEPVRGIVFWLNKESRNLEKAFVRHCIGNSVIETGLTPEADQWFLTLSTCTNDNSETNRWVVHTMLAQRYSRTRD